MGKKNLITKVMMACLILSLLLTGCGGGSPANDSESEEAVVVRLEGGDYGYPQPYTTYSRGPGAYKVNLVFDKLFEKGAADFEPWLVEELEELDGGLRYIMHLRENVRWHDGEPFTAEDVYFTFTYANQNPPVRVSPLYLDQYVIDHLQILDTHTLEMKLEKPSVNLIENLAGVTVIPKHIWENIEDPANFLAPEAVIGTGPFQLTGYNKEQGTYQFNANPEYWQTEVAVDTLEFVPVSDEVLSLETGAIHLSNIPVDVLSRFENKSEFSTLDNPGFWGYRLRLNLANKTELQNVALRQALAYAIDRQELVDKIARGAGVPASMGTLPPDHRWYNPNVPAYQKDTQKARELLEQAGIDPESLEFELLLGENLEVRIGEIIRENLDDIGITLNLRSVDGKSRDARLSEGNYELALVGHGGWGNDPDYLRGRFLPVKEDWVRGVPGYENPELTALLNEQATTLDAAKRKQMIMDAQLMIAADVPEIPLYFNTGKAVFNSQVYDGWMHIFDHHNSTHNKLSYLQR